MADSTRVQASRNTFPGQGGMARLVRGPAVRKRIEAPGGTPPVQAPLGRGSTVLPRVGVNRRAAP